MTKKRFIMILMTVLLLLCIPLIAMQFTKEVQWDVADFLIMGMLLIGTACLCEFTMRKFRNVKHRLLICGAILLIFFLVWGELAVGIFGTPFAGS